MLSGELRSDVLEIAAIAKECPEGLRERCFELLLTHYFDQLKSKPGALPPAVQSPTVNAPTMLEETGASDVTIGGGLASSSEQDLTSNDIHLKAKRFLEKYQKNVEDLNQLFYKEANEVRPLYEDLKTTKTSESQVRVALLLALKSGITTGEFQFDGEEVRKECQTRKFYDASNFPKNFNNNSTLFDGFERYDKLASIIRLSETGRAELAKVIGELR